MLDTANFSKEFCNYINAKLYTTKDKKKVL